MAKGICILLVVFGHQIDWNNPLRNIIYSFHMALFFVISGFIEQLTGGYNKPFRTFLEKKITGLFIPYLIWSGVFMIADFLRVMLAIKPANLLIFDFVAMCSGYGINVLWFLSTLLIAHIINYFLAKRFEHKSKRLFFIILIALIAGALWNQIFSFAFAGRNNSPILKMIMWCGISIFRPFIVSPFICIGSIFSDRIRKIKPYVFPVVTMLFIGINCWISVFFRIKTIFVNIEFGSLFFAYIAGITGSMFVIILSKIICKNSQIIFLRPLFWFGENSLLIMLIHEYFSIRDFIELLCPVAINNYLRLIIVFFCCTAIISFITIIIKKPYQMLVKKIYNLYTVKKNQKDK